MLGEAGRKSTNLVERLRNRSFDTAVPDAISRRILAGGRAESIRYRGARRRITLAAAMVVCALAAAPIGAYYFPVFGQALADSPMIGNLVGKEMRTMNLAGETGNVTRLDSEASSSGIKLQLVGGYADSEQTVLLFRNPPGFIFNPLSGSLPADALTDQFGHNYKLQGAVTNADDGTAAFTFEPLAWPATLGGARLTVHLKRAVAYPRIDAREWINGDWTLQAVLQIHQLHSVAAPAGAVLGGRAVTFSSVTFDGGILLLKGKVFPFAEQLDWSLTDVHGHARPANEGAPSYGYATAEVRARWLDVRPGTYTLRIDLGHGNTFERQLDLR